MNCATPSAPAGLVTSVRNRLSCHRIRVKKEAGSRLVLAAWSTIWQISWRGFAAVSAASIGVTVSDRIAVARAAPNPQTDRITRRTAAPLNRSQHRGAKAGDQVPKNAVRRVVSVQAVKAARRAGEQRRLLVGRAARGDALEGVPEHLIAAASFIDREVAFEHRACAPERLDAGLDIGPPQCRKLFRAGRKFTGMHIEAEHPHAEPAELHMHIRAAREFCDAVLPLGENVVALAGIGADADRPADMVEHDRRLRKGARLIDELAELREIHPRFEAEAERMELGEALAHLGVQQQTGGAVA